MPIDRDINKPLYRQVYDNLLKMITEKKWQEGELLPSERELSEMFQVNRLTLRRALDMIVQDGLVEKIAGLGTRVTKRSLPLEDYSASHNLIFLLPKIPKNIISADRITEPFNSSLFYSIENECKKKGYSLIYTTLGEEESLTEIIKDKKIPGVFFVSKVSENFLTEAKHLNIPSVVINNENDYFPTIRPDRVTGTYEAIKHLVNLNHKRIAFISGLPSYITSVDCFEGFKKALSDSGLVLDNSIIKEGDWTFYGGFNAMKEIIREQAEIPTAVFACNDMTAIGAMAALEDAGYSIPQDVSVIGFDDIEQSKYCNPQLTTVKVDTSLIAHVAIQNLFFSIESKEIHNLKIRIPTQFIERDSTGICKKK